MIDINGALNTKEDITEFSQSVHDLLIALLHTEHVTFLTWLNISTGKVVDKTWNIFPHP